MKQKYYVITVSTMVRNTVIVTAPNEDEAIECVMDVIDYSDNDYGEWEVESVSIDYDEE
jgi:hypothetical protein